MGFIGDDPNEYEVEPIEIPTTEPAREPVPAPEPEEVPA